MFVIRKTYIALAMLVFISACSATPNDLSMLENDPYENTNRRMFAFNMGVDTYILEPTADFIANLYLRPDKKLSLTT